MRYQAGSTATGHVVSGGPLWDPVGYEQRQDGIVGVVPARPMTLMSGANVPDFRSAPNQGGNIELYELENQALDPCGYVLAAMRARAPWAGRTLLDLGCGSGYWLAGYADEAAEVIGVEPDPRLLPLAADRDSRVRVPPGSAEHIPLPAGRSTSCTRASPTSSRRAATRGWLNRTAARWHARRRRKRCAGR